MQKACSSYGLWEGLVNNINPCLSIEDSAKQHINLYDEI